MEALCRVRRQLCGETACCGCCHGNELTSLPPVITERDDDDGAGEEATLYLGTECES